MTKKKEMTVAETEMQQSNTSTEKLIMMCMRFQNDSFRAVLNNSRSSI